MEFGVPRRREASSNKEKHENLAVITISEFKGKGTGRTITLNKKAVEGLGIDFEQEARISFSFNSLDESVIIANTTGLEGVAGVKLAKTSKSSSDKAYFEAIKRNFGVKLEDEVELLLTPGEEFNGNKTFTLSILAATAVMAGTVQEAVTETAGTPAAPVAQVADAIVEAPQVPETVEVPAVEEVVDFPEVNETPAVEVPAEAPNPFETPATEATPVEVPQEVVETEALALEDDLAAEAAESTDTVEDDFYSKFEV